MIWGLFRMRQYKLHADTGPAAPSPCTPITQHFPRSPTLKACFPHSPAPPSAWLPDRTSQRSMNITGSPRSLVSTRSCKQTIPPKHNIQNVPGLFDTSSWGWEVKLLMHREPSLKSALLLYRLVSHARQAGTPLKARLFLYTTSPQLISTSPLPSFFSHKHWAFSDTNIGLRYTHSHAPSHNL